MGSGNCDWGIVVAHDLTKKLGSGQHWNAFFATALAYSGLSG